MAAAGLAAGQLAQLLALRTAALDHTREALTAVIQQSSGKDIRLRELEQTVVELRAADRQKNDLLSQVETEITEMRAQMQQAKAHYEVRTRTDHPLDAITVFSGSPREKRSSLAVIKLVLAFLLTLAAVISIIRITQKGVAGRPPGGEEEVFENLSR